MGHRFHIVPDRFPHDYSKFRPAYQAGFDAQLRGLQEIGTPASTPQDNKCSLESTPPRFPEISGFSALFVANPSIKTLN